MKQTGYSKICTAAAVLFLVIFILCLIPILRLSFYAHPATDDYAYGKELRLALVNGTSFLRSIYSTVKRYYFGWQGTFAACIMMALEPGIWGEEYYFITTFVMLGILIIGTARIAQTLLGHYLKLNRSGILIIVLSLLFIAIEMLPSPVQSFFWWNGSVYYTFTYGVMLLFVDSLLRLSFTNKQKTMVVLACAMAVFIGGSNYVTALFSIEFCTLMLLAAILKKRNTKRSLLVIDVVLFFAFLISALAPGNQIRQAQHSSIQPLQAIWMSCAQAGTDIVSWTTPLVVLFLLICIPLITHCLNKVDYDFKYPLLVLPFSFLFFSSLYTPHFYATGMNGPDRINNIIFFMYLWLLLLDLIYLLGWMQHRFNGLLSARASKYMLTGLIILSAVFAIHSVQDAELTSVTAVAELMDQSAAEFDNEQNERYRVCLDSGITNPVFKPLSSTPKLLFRSDLSFDTEDWANTAMSIYYEKESISLEP